MTEQLRASYSAWRHSLSVPRPACLLPTFPPFTSQIFISLGLEPGGLGERDYGQGWGDPWGQWSQAAALGFPSLTVPRRGMVSWGKEGGPADWGACPCRMPGVSEEDQE